MSKYEVKLVNIGEEVDNRIRELEIELKDIRKANDNLTRANETYRQENIDLYKSCHLNEVIELRKRNAFLEKLHSQHRYVFSEIPNTEENMKMVKLMKKHINKDRYTVRWRGQYLIDGEDWRSTQMGNL